MNADAMMTSTVCNNTRTAFAYDAWGRMAAKTAMVEGADRTYFHHDQLGSTRVLTDASKNVVNNTEFTPYGGLFSYAGTKATTRLFTGHD